MVRKKGLKSQKDWYEWSKSGQRPSDIPSKPNEVYRDHGWVSWADWLGNGGRPWKGAWLSHEEARGVVRKKELKNTKDWWKWCKSGQRPSGIPSHPDREYRDHGWVSWPDWLGYGSAGGREEEGASGSRSSSSSRSSSTPRTKKTSKRKKAAEDKSAKRTRLPDPTTDDTDDESSSRGPKPVKIEVEEVGGFSIVSASRDLAHTACGLLKHGPSTS